MLIPCSSVLLHISCRISADLPQNSRPPAELLAEFLLQISRRSLPEFQQNSAKLCRNSSNSPVEVLQSSLKSPAELQYCGAEHLKDSYSYRSPTNSSQISCRCLPSPAGKLNTCCTLRLNSSRPQQN
jgi:hypothetical protein